MVMSSVYVELSFITIEKLNDLGHSSSSGRSVRTETDTKVVVDELACGSML